MNRAERRVVNRRGLHCYIYGGWHGHKKRIDTNAR